MSYTPHCVLLVISCVSFLSASDPVAYTSIGPAYTLAALDSGSGTAANAIYVGLSANAFSLSPDGKTAYLCEENDISALNLITGKPLWQIPALGCSFVRSSPDGATLYALTVLQGTYGEVFVSLDAQTGTAQGYFPVRSGYAMLALPDGSKAYASGLDGVFLLDPTTLIYQAKVCTCKGDLALSPDGKRLYVAGVSPALGYVIDTDTDMTVATIPSPAQGITVGGVAVSPSGAEVFFGTSQGLIGVDTVTNRVAATIPSSDLSQSEKLSTDGQYVYFCPRPGFFPSLLQFDLNGGTFKAAAVGLSSVDVEVVPTTRATYILARPNIVELADPIIGTVTARIAPVFGSEGLILSTAGNAVTGGAVLYPLSGVPGRLEVLSVIDTRTHQVRQTPVPIDAFGGSFATNGDASVAYVATTNAPLTIATVKLATGAVEQTNVLPAANDSQTYTLTVSPDGNSLFVLETASPQLCRTSLPDFTNTHCVVPNGNSTTMTVSTDSQRVFLAVENGLKPGLYEYDANTLAVTRTATLPNMSREVKVIYLAGQRSILVAGAAADSNSQGLVQRIGLDGFEIVAQQKLDFRPTDLAVTPDEAEALLAGSISGTVVLAGNTLAPLGTIPTGLTATVAVAAE